MDPLSSGSYFFQNTKINTENKAKVSMAGAKRVPVAVAASKPLLRELGMGCSAQTTHC